MAAKHILPGPGHIYTSENFDENSTTGADTLDLTQCRSFMLQIFHVSGTPAGSIIMTNTTDVALGLFADLGSAISVVTDGTISRFDEADMPFGVCRIDATAMSGTGAVYVKLEGFA